MTLVEAESSATLVSKTRRIGDGEEPNSRASGCFILQSPLELILLISKHLCPVSLAILSQTCRAMYAILATKYNIKHFTRVDYLEYLASLSRDSPTQWLCEVCLKLHPVSQEDTPAEPWHILCPLGSDVWRSRAYRNYGNCRIDMRLVNLEYRHIQLALKYTRLASPEYEAYLQKLMAPYHNPNFHTHMHFSNEQSLLSHAEYSTQSKIIMGPKGKLIFLLSSIWRYHKGSKALSIEALGDLKICPHLQFYPNLTPLLDYPLGTLGKSVDIAIKAQDIGAEVVGACPRCPTDFSTRANAECIELRVWQNMGPEVSPHNLEWRIHARVVHECFNGINFGFWGPIVYHEPGSVRQLCEEGTSEEEISRLRPKLSLEELDERDGLI
ncbi:uncharacterized protein GGS25DRAFT_200923 [Hypoxylon fragiforme]|uniref:uncharacterized protein n=1 Tax=Hypoxylon fragiforme TaxID=63214 RepID=UPI0020C65634|nr:uncharacterized protein GGS25DRAFT_200923 [Hypoxylon fragiforme]KAI2611550.1 hypothetical protein GGS25DRAFT_200923 [Hypoxylon fragiforme]